MIGTMHIVTGGQYGSEGKGAVTAALVDKLAGDGPPVLIRVAGPNAGHTAYDLDGNKWSLRQIPVGAVINYESPVIIGQQSEIDIEVLLTEIEQLEAAGIPIIDRLVVDEQATVIQPDHKMTEQTRINTGTTGKGIGGARSSRILRNVVRVMDDQGLLPWVRTEDTTRHLRSLGDSTYILEGTQGYGLGLHTPYYPHTTSSNCRAGDFLAMTGIQPWEIETLIPWVVFRAYPIRIAGESGPLYAETTWEGIGQPHEYTTVTQKIRRVGQWDQTLADRAIRANGGADYLRIAFTFADYLYHDLKDKEDNRSSIVTARMEHINTLLPRVDYLGTGPDTGVWDPNRTGLDL